MSEFTKTIIVDGDGGGDETNIAAAITALGGNGGVIYVEYFYNNGNYYPITNPISVPSNVTLIGKGNVILNVTSNESVFVNSQQLTGNERISISGFKIKIAYVEDDYTHPVVHFKQVTNCILEQLSILNDTGSIDPSADAILLEGSGSEDDTCIGNKISQCNINNFESGTGIHLKGGCRYNIVDANSIDQTSLNIHIEQAPKNIISDNILTNPSENESKGLHIDGSDHCNASGNIVSMHHGKGISLEKSQYCTLDGNSCSDNRYEGILLLGINDTPSSYNTISGNSCYQNGVNQSYDGIFLNAYAQYNSVIGNSCCLNSRNGIKEENSNNGYNVFNGNVCHDNGIANLNILNANSITTNNME
jgi:parallel beta-helix repeat protein